MSHGGWAPVMQRVAVTVNGESLDVADLVLLGVLTGEWPAFEDRVALGLELERVHPDEVPAEAVRREATAFRYAHGLISAADFRNWLEARQMTVGQLSGVLRRRLLCQQYSRSERAPASDEEVIGVLAVEALCDGVLARLGDRGIERLAAGQLVQAIPSGEPDRREALMPSPLPVRGGVLAGVTAVELRERVSRVLSLEEALERLRREVAEPSALGRRMAQHALEWTELVGDELRFMREGAAREARLQITADGESVVTVAERAEVSVLDRRLLVSEAPPAAGVSFAAAAIGEVIGPWEENGQWRVMRLRAKVPPSSENESLRERATSELLAERIARYTAGRVTRDAWL